MNNPQKFLATCALISILDCAQAAPVSYAIALTLQTSSPPSLDCQAPAPPVGNLGSFGCVEAGEIYRGHFSIDDAFLATDGVKRDNEGTTVFQFLDFYLPFGQAVENWDTGFLGIIVEGGKVVDLAYAIHGYGGTSTIAFYLPHDPNNSSRNTFYAYDFVSTVVGTVEISEIGEPSSLTLSLPAFALLAAVTRRPRPTARTTW